MRRVQCYSILLSKFANSNIYRTMKMAKFKIWMVALTLLIFFYLNLQTLIFIEQ